MQYFLDYSHHKEILRPFFSGKLSIENNFFDLVHAHFLILIAKKILVKKCVFDMEKAYENKIEHFLH